MPRRPLPRTLVVAALFGALALGSVGTAQASCTDADGDGKTKCQGDCDDSDPNVRPGLPDTACDGVDNDCNGLTDDGYKAPKTTCGAGECFNNGKLQCIEGVQVDTCEPEPEVVLPMCAEH